VAQTCAEKEQKGGEMHHRMLTGEVKRSTKGSEGTRKQKTSRGCLGGGDHQFRGTFQRNLGINEEATYSWDSLKSDWKGHAVSL